MIGIYLGWRGDSSRIGMLQGATFYNRKRTAHRIGENGGSKVLLDLANLTYEINADLDQRRSPGFVTMVTAGHSFGGALVFSAVDGRAGRRMGRAGRRRSPGERRRDQARSATSWATWFC